MESAENQNFRKCRKSELWKMQKIKIPIFLWCPKIQKKLGCRKFEKCFLGCPSIQKYFLGCLKIPNYF